MKASVVIPTYNRRDRVARTIRAVLADDAAAEVIVVIDGCHDGTAELVDRIAQGDRRVRGIFIENSGAAVAKNVGAEHAQHDVIVFLDDDVIAEPNLVRRHLAHHRDGKPKIVLGYMHVALPERRRSSDLPMVLYRRIHEAHAQFWSANESEILEHFWAGNFSMRREDALAVGLHNPQFPVSYYEDYDFGLRCKYAGLTAYFDRSLGARHDMSRTLSGFRRMARTTGHDLVAMRGIDATLANIGSAPWSSWLLKLTADRRVARAVANLLSAAVNVLGLARCFRSQERTAFLLKVVEQGRGARGC